MVVIGGKILTDHTIKAQSGHLTSWAQTLNFIQGKVQSSLILPPPLYLLWKLYPVPNALATSIYTRRKRGKFLLLYFLLTKLLKIIA
jgi:hypothetical protein